MRDVLIGIDAGTSMIKAVAFDLTGRQLGLAFVPNRYTTRPDGTATQPMPQTWADCARTLRDLGLLVPDLAARVAAVAVTGQGDGTWLIDKAGAPVGEGWLWLDARAADDARRLRAAPTDRARFAATGTGLSACQMGAQLVHMKRHMPEAVAAAVTGFHCKDWLYLQMTGAVVTDPSEAVFTFGDFRTGRYDDTVVDALGLRDQRHLLPPILDGVAATLPLTPEAATMTGLLAGTPVSLGYVDAVCTALGAGVHMPGAEAGCSIVGSTGMHMRAVPVDGVTLNEARTGYVMRLPVPGMVGQMQSNMAATLNIDWVMQFAADLMTDLGQPVSRADLIGRMDGWVQSAAPGALIYHPYISDAGERGPFVNNAARASLIGLAQTHRFPDLVRAVFEGLGMAARDCYGAMGGAPAEVRLAGGAARSVALRRVMAASLGRPVRTSSREEAGAAGAAMIAAVAIGAYGSMEDCIAQWVAPLLGPAEPPDADLQRIYEGHFATYHAARLALEPIWHRLKQEHAV